MLAYLIILSTTVAGMMQAPWWAAVAGACVLALLGIAERRGVSTAPTVFDHAAEEPIASVAALVNGSAAASAAFLLGRATGWLWGI